MDIRPMNAGHLDGVAALERSCFAVPWSRAALAEELDNPAAAFLVAEEDGAILGYLGLHRALDEAFIANLAVAPAARRRGVARALLAFAEERERARGGYRLTLEVRASNAAAIALYEGAGYVCDGVRPGFYRLPDEDAKIYSRYLSADV